MAELRSRKETQGRNMKNGKAKQRRGWFRQTEEGEKERWRDGRRIELARVLKENALFSWRYKRAKPQADTWKRRGKRGRGRRHSGDEKRKKSVREKRNALSVFPPPPPPLFLPFSFSPDRYLSGGKSVRKTVRGYEKWKLDAGKSPVDVNANRLRKGGWRSIEMCYSIGARARLGRERVLTGTTRRVFSPRRVIARAGDSAVYWEYCWEMRRASSEARENAATNYPRNLRKNTYTFG